MIALNDREWKEFKIADIFEVSGTVTTKPDALIGNGNVPRITCAATNNGLEAFYKNEATEHSNVLTVDSATIGYISYQENDFIATDHVEKLTCRKNINRNIGLFFKTVINNAVFGKYNYGYKFSQTRIKRQIVRLPVNSEGEPDYEFMEEYIKEKERKLKDRYKEYIKSNIKELQKKITENRDWKEFFVTEIFKNIERGKRLTKANQQHGNIPYVSSTAQNNGIDNFISNARNVRKYENCLSLANSGSVGACFYEPFEFIASDHATALKGEYSKYTYLFIACMLNRLSGKYNFNREINDKRIKREKIYLPIMLDGEPDYKYMEDYMRYLEQKKILQYLGYINRTSSD